MTPAALDPWTCPHARRSLPRLRTYASGHWRYLRQCLDCGAVIGNPIAKATALAEAGDAPEAFDETLYVEQEAARRNAYRQGLEHERAAWWAWYDEYLKTDAWRTRRRKVLQRAGGICEGCRDRPAEHVHHKTYAHAGKELLFELVALCRECHTWCMASDNERGYPDDPQDRGRTRN